MLTEYELASRNKKTVVSSVADFGGGPEVPWPPPPPQKKKKKKKEKGRKKKRRGEKREKILIILWMHGSRLGAHTFSEREIKAFIRLCFVKK